MVQIRQRQPKGMGSGGQTDPHLRLGATGAPVIVQVYVSVHIERAFYANLGGTAGLSILSLCFGTGFFVFKKE